ncbi:MAG TPA: DNA primase catalytic subunit PriS [Methanocorpusculum sp.]|nr:DNA primase catalytic subunit PriS [Methanocorpusculum sp.]
MKPATYEYLQKCFSAYYNGEIHGVGGVRPPDKLLEREWGFILFATGEKSKLMHRHLSFNSSEDLNSYIRTMLPAHVYYSSAYYSHPSAAQMSDKGWNGAELIFDLDSDHINGGSYEDQLGIVKSELLKLIDILTNELSFSKQDLHVNFSGGRGYHIHISIDSVLTLGKSERQELANYVSGTGISIECLQNPYNNGINSWKKRYNTALITELNRISLMDDPIKLKFLTDTLHISQKSSNNFINDLNNIIKIANKSPELLVRNPAIQAIVSRDNHTFYQHIRSMGSQIDGPVSCDIKRLIRAPGSLHGGSGMCAIPIDDINHLESFDPLIDSVVFSDRTVTIDCYRPTTISILGNRYDVSSGSNKVPEALAVYLCCRGIADIIGV